MLVSSADSSDSSIASSSDPHLPYTYSNPSSALSLRSQLQSGSRQQSRKPIKYLRFYSSPMDESPDSTPLQVYGLEQRAPSIVEKPKLLHRVSHALDDIKEDFSLQLDPYTPASKIKRRSTFFDGASGPDFPRPGTADGTPLGSRPLSIISLDIGSQPHQRLSRRLYRRLSIFGGRSKSSVRSGTPSISPPSLIGSSTHYNGNQSQATLA